MEHKILFERITKKLDEEVNEDFIKSTKTENGNTQISERVVIEKIRKVLVSLELSFEEAGSQQSKDFRNVGGIGLNLEIKKTDNTVIYFNDTCPNKDLCETLTTRLQNPDEELYKLFATEYFKHRGKDKDKTKSCQ